MIVGCLNNQLAVNHYQYKKYVGLFPLENYFNLWLEIRAGYISRKYYKVNNKLLEW